MTCPSCGTLNEPGRKFCGECGARLAIACAACGTTNAPTARFCGECGEPLAGTSGAASTALGPTASAPSSSTTTGAHAPERVAERRLVTVLFADLVGFTTLAEGRDPETVRELLSQYFELASDVIGRYGGTVEKFIGDAVMAVWGAPTAHEDDAERAVRAALELVDGVHGLGPGLLARAGVLTGEAAVTLGARDQGMVAGDLVNTASRLQSVAPPGTVLVGESTHRASSGSIAYVEAGEQTLKGKAAPVPAWQALRVIAQRRGRGRDDRLEAPFVGRDSELRLLKDLFHATSRERRVRLVSITGQAGIGKSRLAWEFLKYVDGVVESVWWHEGRSPSYGAGMSFWALGEMVRSRARLLETDDAATTRGRIADMLVEYVPDEAERRRIEPALLALLGVGDAPAGGAELFSAWRTFFERLAATGVVALLFEDLHWADDGTLDFIEHLLEWSRNVPIMIITLSRPELLERRPGWGAGKRSFLALDLQPLDEPAMRELLGGLAPGLPGSAVRSIVARAEGVPLYAVETIRMLVADGRLRERSDGPGFEPVRELGELAVPDTLHALIAARLDSLDPADRMLVQDAAVLGQSFTTDGVAAVTGLDREAVVERLDRLARADLLRQEVDPRSPERGQYTFVQALIREVAYATVSLRDRRTRHLAAARFFEAIGEDELAGALAAHYVAAYRASVEGPEAEAVAAQARLALRGAAERAEALGSPGQAMAFYEQALEVAADDAERASLLERAGLAASAAARSDLAESLLSRAMELREQLGDVRALAGSIAARARALYDGRKREDAIALLEPAIERFAELETEPVFVELQAVAARSYAMQSDYGRALEVAERLLPAAERMGLLAVVVDTLLAKGTVYVRTGRSWEARALLEGARSLAEEGALTTSALRAANILANAVALDDPRLAVEIQKGGLELARRLGQRPQELVLLGNVSEDARRIGAWDWAFDEVAAALELEIDRPTEMMLLASRLFFEVFRGTAGEGEIAELERQLANSNDQDVASGIDDLRAALAFAQGRWSDAAAAWMAQAERSDLNAPYGLPRAMQAAIIGRDADLAQSLLDRFSLLGARGRALDAGVTSVRAGIAALRGETAASLAGFRSAMEVLRDLGLPWDQAITAAMVVASLGLDEPEVGGWIESARVTLRELRADPLVQRVDELIEQARGDAQAASRPSAASRPASPAVESRAR